MIVRRITDAMIDFAPNHIRPAEKSLFRIYRDTRFSHDKRPYKTHVAAWWSHEGLEKTSGAGYYFQVSPKGVVIAAGSYMPEKEQLAAIRNWLLDNHEEFRKILKKPALRKTFSEFEGEALTRPPKGFPADHPGMDLIRCKQWGLQHDPSRGSGAAEGFCQGSGSKHFKLLAPMVDALNKPIAAAAGTEAKGAFRAALSRNLPAALRLNYLRILEVFEASKLEKPIKTGISGLNTAQKPKKIVEKPAFSH